MSSYLTSIEVVYNLKNVPYFIKGKIKNEETDENEKKLAQMGLDLGSLCQLPAKQRDLMMRLQQHGGQSEGEEDKTIVKRERKDSCSSAEENKSKPVKGTVI